MSDHLKLLDGTVEEITKGVAALTPAERAALLNAEQEGKKRKGVIALLKRAEGATDTAATPADTATVSTGADADNATADIARATEFTPSGAPIQSVPDVDPSHPALDADPRANTTADQNRIDFNDPGRPGVDVVSEQLGMTTAADADAGAAGE